MKDYIFNILFYFQYLYHIISINSAILPLESLPWE